MISFESSLIIVVIILIAVALGVVIFSRLIRRSEGLSPQDRITAWEVFTKGVTACTAIIAGLLAFVRYIDQRELELAARNYESAQRVREFNIEIYAQSKTFEEGKRVLLNEAADLVSTLATLEDLEGPTAKIAMDRFERLYHGQLVLYEGKAVEMAMIDFRDAMIKWKKSGTKPTELLPEERSVNDTASTDMYLKLHKKNSDFMRLLALDLSEACEKELKALDDADGSGKGAK
jgi:hypothetical protein